MRNIILLMLWGISFITWAQFNTIPYDVPLHNGLENEWKEYYKFHEKGKGTPTCFAGIGYSYNRILSSNRNYIIGAYIPFSNMNETEVAAQFSSANVYNLSLILRQKYALPVGEIFLEERILDDIVSRSNINDLSMNFLVGYRKEYFLCQVGTSFRIMSCLNPSGTTKYDYITEPWMISYRIEAFARPQRSVWNLSAAISNIDRFLHERNFQPFVEINATYRASNRLRLAWCNRIEEAGSVALSSEFHGITSTLGILYSLK